MLLCPDVGSGQESGKCVVQGNIFNVQFKTYSSDHKIMVYSAYKMQNVVINLVPRVSHLTAWGERGETLVGSGHVLP